MSSPATRDSGARKKEGGVSVASPVGADMCHMSVAEKKKRRACTVCWWTGCCWAAGCVRAREKKLGWPSWARLATFFCFKSFSFSFSVKPTKQKQNKAKFIQTNFVRFVKTNSTTQVTQNRTSRKIILVEEIKY